MLIFEAFIMRPDVAIVATFERCSRHAEIRQRAPDVGMRFLHMANNLEGFVGGVPNSWSARSSTMPLLSR